jgi:hypothetical protein
MSAATPSARAVTRRAAIAATARQAGLSRA